VVSTGNGESTEKSQEKYKNQIESTIRSRIEAAELCPTDRLKDQMAAGGGGSSPVAFLFRSRCILFCPFSSRIIVVRDSRREGLPWCRKLVESTEAVKRVPDNRGKV
jgi:hypothetical protein